MIGVASFDNTHIELTRSRSRPTGARSVTATAAASPPAPTTGTTDAGEDRDDDDDRRRVRQRCRARQHDGQGVLIRRSSGAAPARSTQGDQRPERRCGGSHPLQQRRRARLSPTVAGTPPITIPVVAISGRRRRHARRPDRRRPASRSPGATERGHVPERDRRADLVLQLVRAGGRRSTLKPDIGAPGGLHPVDVSARAGRLRDDQRHLDGLAARRGRRRAAAAGAAEHVRRGTTSAPCSRTAPTRSRGRERRTRVPRQRPPAGCRHARHRRRDPRRRRRSRPASSRSARAWAVRGR